VVNMLHEAWTDDNYATGGTSVQFGPFTSASAISRLVRIRAIFTVSEPGIDLAPTAVIGAYMCWGVQSGSPGYTPQVLPGQIGGFNFYWSELLGGDLAAAASWTPPANDVGWMPVQIATREWRGQLPIGENQDFYVTGGALIASPPTFAASCSLEIDYSD